ncbi:hypothetical protein, partial [uncultured Nitrospira sp.]|uniref:hypothetical protein n=1 Tax=uncultured Nitrospira sp. TaxID=157176 RepID=UPI0031406F20
VALGVFAHGEQYYSTLPLRVVLHNDSPIALEFSQQLTWVAVPVPILLLANTGQLLVVPTAQPNE